VRPTPGYIDALAKALHRGAVGTCAKRQRVVAWVWILAVWLGTAACSSAGSDARRSGGPGGNARDAGTDAATDAASHAGDAGLAALDAAADASAEADADTTGCGDGKLQPSELCDDGNSAPADGCSSRCDAIEQNFVCPVPGKACVSTVECGDSKVTGNETCDDGNLGGNDGCALDCQLEPGYRCPTPGARCIAAKCGDGLVAGGELCDDGDDPPAAADGCGLDCRLEEGWKCDTAGAACAPTDCGDGLAEGTEQCDDGDNDLGDLCTPECKREPDCSAGACVSTCGDGIKLSTDTEQCDDGNAVNRDGCSKTCKIESGWKCPLVGAAAVTQLVLPIVIRDFKAYAGGTGHIDFENYNGADADMVTTTLGSDGKPVYAGQTGNPSTHGQAAFDQWYRDVAGVNQTFVQSITLTKQLDGTFVYDNAAFWPIDNLGWGNEGNNHNFHFTSEVRYWFEYKRGQKLDFRGDDDVWVFVNRIRAVDLGGVHGPADGSITLDAANEAAYGLTEGNIYEIVVFQAERHTTGSNYKLTLSDFVSTRSQCTTECGDAIVAGEEECDDGKNDGSYGSCTSTCKRAPHCGDGLLQAAQETCDDGLNLTTYSPATAIGCAPGCKHSAYCGDKHVDALFGEECDDGDNPGGYDNCQPDCTIGPRCGDKHVDEQHGEECDDGNLVSGDGCARDCTSEAPE
jgi:fibro-slime domain-containing protein